MGLDDSKFERFVSFAYEYKEKHKFRRWSRAINKIFEEWCTRHSEEATPYITLQDRTLGEQPLVWPASDHPAESEISMIQKFNRVHNLNDAQFGLLLDIAYRYAEVHNIQLTPRILKRIYQEHNTSLAHINKH